MVHRASTDWSMSDIWSDDIPSTIARFADETGSSMTGDLDTFGSAAVCVSRSDTSWRARNRSVPGSKVITIDERPGTESERISWRNATPLNRSCSSGTVMSCSTSSAERPSASVCTSIERCAPSQREREQQLGDEVAIADRVDAVLRDGGEAEAALEQHARDRDTRSRRPRRSRAAARPRRVTRQRAARDRARAARSATASSARPTPAARAAGACTPASARPRALRRDRPSPAAARARPRRACVHASIVQSRVAVATWSLRLRPVCSFDATSPISSCSSRSISVCTSSSDAQRRARRRRAARRPRRARARSPCSPRA